MKRFVILLVILNCLLDTTAQKLPFSNFGVDKGLIQSQVQCITQDKQHHIWLGTFGGLDRFDGNSFKHFSKLDGLNSNAVTALYAANDGKIWAGTFKGISCYDGFRVTNYNVPPAPVSFNFSVITEDDEGVIWAFHLQTGLLVFLDNQFSKAKLPVEGGVATCLYRNDKGQLFVNIFQHGIFLYEKKKWTKIAGTGFLEKNEFISILIFNQGAWYALTSNLSLVKFIGDKIMSTCKLGVSDYASACFDSKGDIWIGTNKGVRVLNGENLSLVATYTAAYGLSDNYVLDIFRDTENNIWLGSDGDGFFRYSGGSFTKFDGQSGLPGNIVMGLAKDNANNFFIGTREGGLVNYTRNGKLVPLDYSFITRFGVNCMAVDNKNNLFIGTIDKKLLRYDGRSFREIIIDQQLHPFANAIRPDEDKIWLGTSTGCYYLLGEKVYKIKGIDLITSDILPVDATETLAVTTDGIYSIRGNEPAQKLKNPGLKHADASCIAEHNGLIWIGTIDDGVYVWNRKTDNIYKCNTRNGLSDNQVFSIYTDSKGSTWIGTGTGVQQIGFNERDLSFSVKQFSKTDGYENAENNLNTITEDQQGRVWIGTTKGVFIFSHDSLGRNEAEPFTVIQRVSSPGLGNDSLSAGSVFPWYHLPVSPKLSYRNNSISFVVKGIYLKDPDAVLYSYQLAGYDTGFSVPASQSFFNFQNLEPGHYIFRVRSMLAGRPATGTITEYRFSVATPFHKSKGFLILVTAGLILTGIMIQFLYNRTKQRRQQQLELLRQEELQKVRQRTSEDFHDELGNKLARISLLADILQKKVRQNEPGKSDLIRQISANVQLLYAGTKDIIWSLSPGSDDLPEVLKRIEQFGTELFHDSEIDFSMEGLEQIEPGKKLPIGHSHNLIMIFKELLNNCLRHARSASVKIIIKDPGNNSLLISLQDNGTGFDPGTVQKGNGLNNIQRRAQAIGAIVDTASVLEKGTVTTLIINIPSNGG